MNSESLQNQISDAHLQGKNPSETNFGSDFSHARGASSNWQRLVARPRIDQSNIDEIHSWAKEMRERGEAWLVIDLKGTRFMSLPVILFLENLSNELKQAGGALAMVSMPDKTRRIFETYGSLKNIYLVEKLEGLKAARAKMMNPFFQLKNI